MEPARSFRDLNVYKLARENARTVFHLSKTFPREERFSLTDQIRRSSRAVKQMVAEGWARRRYIAVFVCKLDEALGEATETQGWLDDALDCGYINEESFQDLDSRYQHIGGMLRKMIERADDFCKEGPPAREKRGT